MMNKKPETSLEEDLKTLGLLAGDAAAKKSLSEDDAGGGDEDKADHDEKDEKAEKKDDDGEKKEPEHKDEKQDKELFKDMMAGKKTEARELPNFLKAKEEEELVQSYTEQLEAAWDVVHHYYKLDEAEDQTLTMEDLRTVIEAQTFIIEAAYNDAEPTKEPKDIPGANKVDAFPPEEDPTKKNAAFEGPLGLGKKVTVAGDGYNLSKTGAAKGDKGEVYSPRHRSQPAPTNESTLDALVSELKSIQSAVVESAPTAEQLEVSQRLIEGFEAVRDTAAAVFQGIDAELAESENVAEDDARLSARSFFEGIANDAGEILNAIATGEVEIADAAADLNTISNDLKQGLDGLNGVA